MTLRDYALYGAGLGALSFALWQIVLTIRAEARMTMGARRR